MGIAAAFMVPLFLNMISSTLIRNSYSDPSQLFVLSGFCLAAAVFARQFIGSVGEKALELLKQQERKVDVVAYQSAEAVDFAMRADNRAIAMYEVLGYIDRGDYKGALSAVDKVLTDDSKNPEAWAWKAYCLKREGQVHDAVKAIVEALKLERRGVFSWLYNLACYQSLSGESADTVVQTLKQAQTELATNEQFESFADDLHTDQDFDSLRESPAFVEFVGSLPVKK